MAKAFTLSVVAPDRAIVDGEQVTSVVAPGVDGYFGIQADHLPLISVLKPGLLEFSDVSNNRRYVYVGGGFAEVRENKVMILADEAALGRDIDVQRAEQDLENARRALRGEQSTVSGPDAVHELEKAMQRLRAARAVR